MKIRASSRRATKLVLVAFTLGLVCPLRVPGQHPSTSKPGPRIGDMPVVEVSSVTVRPEVIHEEKAAGPQAAVVTVTIFHSTIESDQSATVCFMGEGPAGPPPSVTVSFDPECQIVTIPAHPTGNVAVTTSVGDVRTYGLAEASIEIRAWLANCSPGMLIMPSPPKSNHATLTVKNP